jgi:hypothetical protein
MEQRLVHVRRHDGLGRQDGLRLGDDAVAIIENFEQARPLREGVIALLLDLNDDATESVESSSGSKPRSSVVNIRKKPRLIVDNN